MKLFDKAAVWLRLLVGGLFFVLSLLALFKAPATFLWKLAILATEWGHVFAFLALLLFLPGWRRSRKNQIAAMLGLITAVVVLTPLFRAMPVAKNLSDELGSTFGETQPLSVADAPSRPHPCDCRAKLS